MNSCNLLNLLTKGDLLVVRQAANRAMFGDVRKQIIKLSRLRTGPFRGALLAVALLLAGLVVGWSLIYPRSGVPDFRELTAGPERKTAFFAFARPLIEAGNADVREDRARLLEIVADEDPGWLDRLWLARLADDYGLGDEDLDDPETIETLVRRVDTVPLSLALAQAAKESGWGTSRFARQGNNLFGEWCFDKGCGIVPKARAKGRFHEVESFSSPQQSVASYLNNINTHDEYREFRIERERQRAARKRLSGLSLAESLTKYSERRDRYVEELRRLIETNDLEPRHDNSSD